MHVLESLVIFSYEWSQLGFMIQLYSFIIFSLTVTNGSQRWSVEGSRTVRIYCLSKNTIITMHVQKDKSTRVSHAPSVVSWPCSSVIFNRNRPESPILTWNQIHIICLSHLYLDLQGQSLHLTTYPISTPFTACIHFVETWPCIYVGARFLQEVLCHHAVLTMECARLTYGAALWTASLAFYDR